MQRVWCDSGEEHVRQEGDGRGPHHLHHRSGWKDHARLPQSEARGPLRGSAGLFEAGVLGYSQSLSLLSSVGIIAGFFDPAQGRPRRYCILVAEVVVKLIAFSAGITACSLTVAAAKPVPAA